MRSRLIGEVPGDEDLPAPESETAYDLPRLIGPAKVELSAQIAARRIATDIDGYRAGSEIALGYRFPVSPSVVRVSRSRRVACCRVAEGLGVGAVRFTSRKRQGLSENEEPMPEVLPRPR